MPSAVKDYMIKEIKESFESNPYIFVSSFQNLPVGQIGDLRGSLEKVSTRSMVIKHTLAKRVFGEMEIGVGEDFFSNSLLVTLGDRDPQEISKKLVEFSKTNTNFSPAGVVFEKKAYDKAYVEQLAKMPSKQELLTQMVVSVKSPITGLVMTLGQLVRGLVIAVNEIKKQKEAAAAA